MIVLECYEHILYIEIFNFFFTILNCRINIKNNIKIINYLKLSIMKLY